MAATIATYDQLFVQLMPLMSTYAPPTGGITVASRFIATLWLSLMQRYLELRERGVPLCALRYEDLKAAPEEMVAAVFAYCDLPAVNLRQVISVFDEDSQRGTRLSQAQSSQNPYVLTDQQLAEIRAMLQLHPVLNTPDIILPNTLSRHPQMTL